MLLSERIKADGLTIESTHVRNFTTPEGIERARWEVKLHYREETPLTISDWECSTEDEPTVLDVMGVLVANCNRVSVSDDFEEWASEFSSNPAGWPPRETYDAWCQMAWELRVMLGDRRYDDYVFNTERDD